MKKFLITFIAVLLISSNAGAFYIWQDFDNPSFPPAGWTLANSNAYNLNWYWSIRGSGYGTGYGSIKANFNDVNTNVSFDVISPVFNSASAGDSLIFDHAYCTYGSAVDKLKISYSTDGGVSWTELITLNGGTAGPLTTAPATGVPFIPTPAQWATKKYSLPTGTNKIKFTGTSALGNNLYLDNIKIGTRLNADVGAVGPLRHNRAVVLGASDTPKVMVRNFGTTTQSFPLTLAIPPSSYLEIQNISNLAPGESRIINFPSFSATLPGVHTATAYTELSTDQNKSNDTIYTTYTVTNNPRNVLIEYCTGAWCQWCPCAKTNILDLENYFPNTIVLAYHGGGSDPFINFNGSNIISLFGMNAYPVGMPDRTANPSTYISAGGLFESPFMRYLSSPESPVLIDVISKSYNSSTNLLNVSLNATALTNLSGQYKISYVITEDNLISTQQQNSYCPGGAGYVNKWVVRNMINNATGENLNTGGTWNNGQMISKAFYTTLNSAWIPANCKLTIFIYKDGSPLYMAEVQQSIQTGILINGINDPIEKPATFELLQNYPNPFNPVTNIKFSLAKDGFTKLKIYDVSGKLVNTFFNDYLKAGYYNAEFDGSNFSSGTYFYTLESGNFRETKKMMLVK